MNEQNRDHPGVIAPPPVIFLIPLLVGILLSRYFPITAFPQPESRVLGWILVAAGILLAGIFFFTFRRAGTNVRPDQPALVLVTHGPYRFTRNPAYVSMTLFYTGVALLAHSLWALILLPVVLVVINRGVIAREERYLEAKFGEPYRQFKSRVRRWV